SELTGWRVRARARADRQLAAHCVEAAVAEVDPRRGALDEGAEAVHALLASSLCRRLHVVLARIHADGPAAQAPGHPHRRLAAPAGDVQHPRAALQAEEIGQPVGWANVAA